MNHRLLGQLDFKILKNILVCHMAPRPINLYSPEFTLKPQ